MTLASRSEDNGLSPLMSEDKLIYSVGISTGGIAEIRMVQSDLSQRVIAKTWRSLLHGANATNIEAIEDKLETEKCCGDCCDADRCSD